MKTLNMPSFGADMAEGTLIEWKIQPGDAIHRGDVVAVIETHKGAIELDLFEEGVVDSLLIGPGDKVAVGTPIARLLRPDEAAEAAEVAPAAEAPAGAAETPAAAPPAAGRITTPAHASVPLPGRQFIPASPAARQLAHQKGISLVGIQGSGPGGAILLQDVEELMRPKAAAPSPAPEPAATPTGFDFQAMRQAISATVTRSKREIPHYYLSQTLDISRLEHFLSEYNQPLEPEQRLLLAAPLLCAVARTLVKHSALNGLYEGEQFQPAQGVQLANAVTLRGGGLVMPIIRDAEQLDARGMMQRLGELVIKARAGTLRHSELNGATCTVTSIGERGCETIFGVIYPPQVAIIGLGKARRAPLVEEDALVVRSVMTASLAADHRVSDGHLGALFLHDLNKILQKPEALWTQANSNS